MALGQALSKKLTPVNGALINNGTLTLNKYAPRSHKEHGSIILCHALQEFTRRILNYENSYGCNVLHIINYHCVAVDADFRERGAACAENFRQTKERAGEMKTVSVINLKGGVGNVK